MSLEPTEALCYGQSMILARYGSNGKAQEFMYHLPVNVLAMLTACAFSVAEA